MERYQRFISLLAGGGGARAAAAARLSYGTAVKNGSHAGPSGGREPSFARARRLFGRALLLRCPNCGRGRVLRNWFVLRERCSKCQVWLEREEGYFVGAMAINIVLGEFLPIFGAVAVIISTWPSPPWPVLQIAIPLSMGLGPVILFPFSRTLWLALDWTFRPPSRDNRLDHPRPGGPVTRRSRTLD